VCFFFLENIYRIIIGINCITDMSKRTVRLTESELKNIISETVKRILKEADYSPIPNHKPSQWSDKEKLFNDKEFAMRYNWDDLDALESGYSNKDRREAMLAALKMKGNSHVNDKQYNRLGIWDTAEQMSQLLAHNNDPNVKQMKKEWDLLLNK
jgi:hypothetical protein